MLAVTGNLTGEGVYARYFRAAQRTAVHVEVQDSYDVPDEYEPLARWRETGEILLTDGDRRWAALMRETIARGVRVARVRVVTVPHTEYVRWLLAASDDNADAGEQIRWLPRHLAVDAAPPSDDYWLFDDTTVAFNTVDEASAAVGLAVTTDPAQAALCARAWTRLWDLGVDHHDYQLSEHARR
jgi:hypothetical protein